MHIKKVSMRNRTINLQTLFPVPSENLIQPIYKINNLKNTAPL